MTTRFKAALVSDRLIILVPGKLVLGAEATLRELLVELPSNGFKRIALDLSNCTYVDSSGLGLFAFCAGWSRRYGGSFAIHNCPKRIRDLLTICKLIDLFEIVDMEVPPGAIVEISSDDLTSLGIDRYEPTAPITPRDLFNGK